MNKWNNFQVDRFISCEPFHCVHLVHLQMWAGSVIIEFICDLFCWIKSRQWASDFLLTKCCLFRVDFNHIAHNDCRPPKWCEPFLDKTYRHSHAKHTQFIHICIKDWRDAICFVSWSIFLKKKIELNSSEIVSFKAELKRLKCSSNHLLVSPEGDVVLGCFFYGWKQTLRSIN